MDIIENLSKSLNLDTNVILFSFILAIIAIFIIVVLVICLLVVSLRNGLHKGEKEISTKEKSAVHGKREARKRERVKKERPPRRERGKRSTAPTETPAPAPSIAVPTAEVKIHAEASASDASAVLQPEPVPASDSEPATTTTEQSVSVSESTQPDNAAPSEPEDGLLSSAVDDIAQKHGREEPASKKQKVKAAVRKEYRNKKQSAKALKKKAKKLTIPKTVQDSIPYTRVYPDTGIIETEPGHFTKSYLLDDVNYSVAKYDEQADMFLKYAEFMNSFDTSTRFQITINQKNMNLDEFEADTMLPMKEDGLDHLRVERNEMLRAKIREGKNELVKEKYLTVSTVAQDYESALTIFARLETEITENIKKIGGAAAHPLSSAKRLEILHDIYNPDSVGLFGNNLKHDRDGNLVFEKEKFRFDIMRRMGLTTKDMIGPESFSYKSDFGMMGGKYFRALFMRMTQTTSIKDNYLKDLTDMEANMITSLIYQPIDAQAAIKMARQDIVNVNANMIDKQKQASKSGYSVELINPELRDAAEEANALRDDLTRKNQKLFFLTFVVVHFADTKEQLDSDTKSIQAIGRRHHVDIKSLSWQQENGLDSALPLCNNKLEIKRSLTTEGCAVFMPFVNQELNDRDGGMYYGNNAVSHNLIMLNRRNSKNGNGFIFGTSGSGKSMSGKQEMLTVLLSSNDDVIVIDPEGEYKPMADLLNGEVIPIAPGTDYHINPFDIDLNCDGEDDPITLKSDFICSICETIAGDRYGLTPGQRSLIDRCVKKVYEPYLNSRDPETGKYDSDKLPTFVDFYNQLLDYNGYDAMQLADGLEIYVTGSQNLFAYKTNVEYSKRFVVYDISKIGQSMKSLGLLVVLDNIWNRMVANRDQGSEKFIWFFIDEIYLLFKVGSSAEFLKNLYKRARKYGGIPTGITQNVTDLLENDTARTMISNSEYIQMLSQSPLDRAQLCELLNISTTQMGYITNASPGHGLIYDGTHIVPFINKLPKNTMQYEAMTSKPKEMKERDERKREEELSKEATAANEAYEASIKESEALETSDPAEPVGQ